MPENFLNRIHKLFNNKKARKPLLKLRVPLGLILFVLLSSIIKLDFFFWGLAVSVLGEIFQVWCMSTIKTKKKLTVVGPYMFMRNPMYIGRFFLIFGIIMMTGNPWLLGGLTILYYFYMVNRVKREEKILSDLFGKAYEDYCREVNRYVPSFARFDRSLLRSFNKESFIQNNVHWNILEIAICYLILYAFAQFWTTY
ncbi:MAG: methyltransferase family protein [Dissulfuribacterales bacterium]